MSDFNRRLGEHIRRLRKLQGLSLLDVESVSGKEVKASVLGAYERGERVVSAPRLARLAEIYGVPLRAMLPSPPGSGGGPAVSMSLDLNKLQEADSADARTVVRYVRSIQAQRAEWSGNVFSIRGEDVRALSTALDVTPEELVRRLDELGVRLT
ncbi:MAG TPA: transcriptional regulator [Actinomycetota bacterium]|nr:transcriptional regulator [Actinomycetota bacterium]